MNYSTPQKLAPIALARVFSRIFKTLAAQLWPLILAYFFQVSRRDPEDGNAYFIYVIYGVIFLTIANAVIRYLTFRWQLDGDAVRIRHGVFRKVDLRIPFERIQAIDLREPWYYRLAGAVRFVIDTAGSKSKEAEIWALEREAAEALRRFMLEGSEVAIASDETAEAASQKHVEWIRVDPLTLVKIGLFRNHFRSIAAFIGGAIYIYSQLQEIFETEEINAEIAEVYAVVPKVLSIAIILGVLVLGAAILFSVVLTVFLFFGFRLVEAKGSFTASYGLINTKTRQLKPEKVQIMRTEQGPLFRWLGILRFKIEQAYAQKNKGKEDFSIPGSPTEMVLRFRERLFGALPKQHHPGTSAKWIFYRVVRLGLIPLLPIAFLYGYTEEVNLLFAALWLPFQWGYSYLLWRNQRVVLTDGVLVVSRRIWFERTSVLSTEKVQAVQLRSSIYQRRHSLSTLVIETAGGSVSIPFIPEKTANELADFLLYRSQLAGLNWM